ncbi:MAG: hypothetical protein L3J49_03195 [Desulfobulbaceae bacterium]|nr:hypothetical protein [Desulfobulbaceae bacterium]
MYRKKKLIPSYVCYADILGFSQLSLAAIEAGEGDQFLKKIRKALNKGYTRLREQAARFSYDEAQFSIKVFTDNIVIGYPAEPDGLPGYGEGELGNLCDAFSEFQLGLAQEGFLVRGGIAHGAHYMDEDIVFGDALLEAVKQDKGGGPPCITLAPSAVQMLNSHMRSYGHSESAPQRKEYLHDADGALFVDYLSHAFFLFPDVALEITVIAGHKQTIFDGLQKHQSNPGVRSKYEWTARYHNFACREFAEQWDINPADADEERLYQASEAQEVLKHLIDIESLATTPYRMDIGPSALAGILPSSS